MRIYVTQAHYDYMQHTETEIIHVGFDEDVAIIAATRHKSQNHNSYHSLETWENQKRISVDRITDEFYTKKVLQK